MTKSCEAAFAVVDLIRKDDASRTRGVDAFCLALIRSERQIRRIFTNLVFQSSAFDRHNVPKLRETLGKRKRLFFRHFQISFKELVDIPISDLIADFERLSIRMIEATEYRNKLFHGQLTGGSLTTSYLLSLEDDIRAWCYSLSDRSHERFGYDGFAGSTSFMKTGRSELSLLVSQKIPSVEDYAAFLVRLEGSKA
ncbi:MULTISPECIES: hypothetical protein [unclassified Rhizobium]|uniref:hypothetical protein n=1 Tax=unclassified Rhizobium TaxID=2613769 RepID=UPI00288BEE84|nr:MULTISPECIES: hypothetical protein [unclassified Rhizobium]